MSFLINAKRAVNPLRDVPRKKDTADIFFLLTIPDSRISLAKMKRYSNWAANSCESHVKKKKSPSANRYPISWGSAFLIWVKIFKIVKIFNLSPFLSISFNFSLVLYHHRFTSRRIVCYWKRITFLSLSPEFLQCIHSGHFILGFFYRHTFRKRVLGRWNYFSLMSSLIRVTQTRSNFARL